MRKSLKNIVSLVLLFVLVLSMSACGSKTSEINNLMKEFENSCNKLDLNAMLDCINPQVADGVRLATGIVGMFANKDTDEMLDGLAAILLDEIPSDTEEFFSSIKFETQNINVKGETANSTSIVKYTIAGEDYEDNAVFEYIYIDEKWYISDLNIE